MTNEDEDRLAVSGYELNLRVEAVERDQVEKGERNHPNHSSVQLPLWHTINCFRGVYLVLILALVASRNIFSSFFHHASAAQSELQPDARRALESRSKCDLHDPMSLLEGVGLLMLLDVFQLIPDRGGAGVSII